MPNCAMAWPPFADGPHSSTKGSGSEVRCPLDCRVRTARLKRMIDIETHDGVTRLTLNRPEARNALNAAGMAALDYLLRDLERAQNARVLVIRATGKAFSAGRDLKEAPELSLAEAMEQHDHWAT